jgi:GMP synthase (glutamine-hydrolysing)
VTAPPPAAGQEPAVEKVIVTRLVEATRLVEREVVVTRVAPLPTVAPSPEPPKQGIVWYVDIEHEKVLKDPERGPDHFRVRNYRAGVQTIASAAICDSIHYTEVSGALAAERQVRAIAISGNVTDWEEYDFARFQPLFEIVKAGRIPVIGFCGGHQLLGLMYDAECGPLRKLKPGEQDPEPGFAPGYYKEVGYKPVQVVKEDPLFEGLSKEPVFFESHYWEVKQLPADFELLASTDDCRVQAMKHKRFTIYGTQFHPEAFSVEHDDGLTLLGNFYRLAGIRQ